MKWLVAILVLGATCVGLDHLHATHGVLAYPEHFRKVWDQPLWVGPLFLASAAMGLLAASLVRRWAGAEALPPPSWREVAGDWLSFVLAYASTSYFYQHPTALTGVLVGFWIVRSLRAPAWVIVAAVVGGVAGPLVEVVISSAGGFTYLVGDTLAVPRWLPGIYLHAGVLAATVAARLSSPRAAAPAPG